MISHIYFWVSFFLSYSDELRAINRSTAELARLRISSNYVLSLTFLLSKGKIEINYVVRYWMNYPEVMNYSCFQNIYETLVETVVSSIRVMICDIVFLKKVVALEWCQSRMGRRKRKRERLVTVLKGSCRSYDSYKDHNLPHSF